MCLVYGLTVDELSSSGVFSKGYTSYLVDVHTSVRVCRHPTDPSSEEKHSGDGGGNPATQFIQRKRYTDFCTFHAQLERRFPLSILPPLPPKSPAAAVAEKRQGESIPEMRQRLLRLWLQHVLLHTSYLSFPPTREFVTGISAGTASNSKDTLAGWDVDGVGGTTSSKPKGAPPDASIHTPSAASKQESTFSDEYEDSDLNIMYEGFLEADGVVRSSRAKLSSEPHADMLSEAIKYKCQQDRHSVARCGFMDVCCTLHILQSTISLTFFSWQRL